MNEAELLPSASIVAMDLHAPFIDQPLLPSLPRLSEWGCEGVA